MPTVLFVCVQNAFRSQMAAALFARRAPEGWTADSAGLRPGDAIHPTAIAVLREIGVDLSGRRPKLLTRAMMASAHRVVAMGCADACPAGFEDKTEDWALPDPKGKPIEDVRRLRDEVAAKVDDLIDRLGTAAPA